MPLPHEADYSEQDPRVVGNVGDDNDSIVSGGRLVKLVVFLTSNTDPDCQFARFYSLHNIQHP